MQIHLVPCAGNSSVIQATVNLKLYTFKNVEQTNKEKNRRFKFILTKIIPHLKRNWTPCWLWCHSLCFSGGDLSRRWASILFMWLCVFVCKCKWICVFSEEAESIARACWLSAHLSHGFIAGLWCNQSECIWIEYIRSSYLKLFRWICMLLRQRGPCLYHQKCYFIVWGNLIIMFPFCLLTVNCLYINLKYIVKEPICNHL